MWLGLQGLLVQLVDSICNDLRLQRTSSLDLVAPSREDVSGDLRLRGLVSVALDLRFYAIDINDRRAIVVSTAPAHLRLDVLQQRIARQLRTHRNDSTTHTTVLLHHTALAVCFEGLLVGGKLPPGHIGLDLGHSQRS